uniref:Uncharacterized protein n=1 Tax=Onchocerca volvulus TaxID=6282 RepID=A0A8R1Y526_ONCVO
MTDAHMYGLKSRILPMAENDATIMQSCNDYATRLFWSVKPGYKDSAKTYGLLLQQLHKEYD